jgi:hypothetical protein
MAATLNLYRRLEPDASKRDLDKGFAAEVADPLWFLTRQWQLGEHQGEDASSPVKVICKYAEVPLELPSTSVDASSYPTEALVEAEPEQWWTPGRRISIGRDVARRAEAAGIVLDGSRLLLSGLPHPYSHLDGRGFDGLVLYRNRRSLGLPDDWFGSPPADTPDHWSQVRLEYDAELRAGDERLFVRRHEGGDLRWYAADGDGRFEAPATKTVTVYPDRLRYPGAPLPRWWALEDPGHDVGGFAPDRTHFATLLMIEIVSLHADNWFGFPITMNNGHVLQVRSATVTDSFGEPHSLHAPSDGWSLYDLQGFPASSLVMFAGNAIALSGPPLERVDVFADEDANLAWAVERIVGGRNLSTTGSAKDEAPSGEVDATRPITYRYEPSHEPPPGWHPYPFEMVDEPSGPQRRFVQGRLADLSIDPPGLRPAPTAALLFDASSGARHPVHQLDPSALASRGVRLERAYRLARDHAGKPILWIQRSKAPRTEWASSQLDFDIAKPEEQPPE